MSVLLQELEGQLLLALSGISVLTSQANRQHNPTGTCCGAGREWMTAKLANRRARASLNLALSKAERRVDKLDQPGYSEVVVVWLGGRRFSRAADYVLKQIRVCSWRYRFLAGNRLVLNNDKADSATGPLSGTRSFRPEGTVG